MTESAINIHYLQGLEESGIHDLIRLDKAGFFPAPEESFEDFKARVLNTVTGAEDTASILAELKSCLPEMSSCKAENRIPQEIMLEASKRDIDLFSFSVDWVPGFFSSAKLGILWGGCALYIPERNLHVFVIRSDFKEKSKWFIYDRNEILSHELCHTARQVLGSTKYEEHFAYMTSTSPLRNFMGSCFKTAGDALLFLLPVMLLPFIQIINTIFDFYIPVWPFWLLVLAVMSFFFFRNIGERGTISKARQLLLSSGVKEAVPILFRCTDEEINEIAALQNDAVASYIKTKAESEMRWKIIDARFINPIKETQENETKSDSQLP